MRKLLAIVLVITLVLSVFPVTIQAEESNSATSRAQTENLVQNPSFEDDFLHWDEDWGNNAIVSHVAHTGTKSLQIGADGGRAQILDGYGPGQEFTLEFWGKVDAAGSVGYAGVDCLDANGKKIPGGQFQTEVESLEFGKYIVKLVTVEGTDKLQVWTWGGRGYTYYDDFVLTGGEKVQPAPSPTPAPTPVPADVNVKRINALWGVNDGEKVEKDDLDNPNKNSNSAWDGQKIKIFGGRNEIISFQLIVEATEAGINELSVSLPSLMHKDGLASIVYAPPSDEDPTDYRGRPIQIFTENYMNITNPTNASWITRPYQPYSPEDMTGWKPVQLVPENAKVGKGGLPITVYPKNNQGIWFDIYTYKDLPAGIYEGTITVKADNETRTVPVELELFDFTLPDENSMNFMIFYDTSRPDEYEGADYQDRYHRLAHRNRVEFTVPYDENSVREVMGRFTGEDFTREKGYEGPGEGVGYNILPRNFYGSQLGMFDTQEEAWANSDSWMKFMNENFPDKLTFLYMPDEPGPSQFPYIQEIARYIHTNPGPGKDLKIFVTHNYSPELDGPDQAVDIWAVIPNRYDPERAAIERSQGDDMIFYNGMRPYVGTPVMDAPATDCRVIAWACYKHDIKTYFYWLANHWHHNSQAPAGYERVQNVWANPMTFNNGSAHGNGDGVLVYPGTDIIHPEESRDIKGPISSIRLANMRRGAQDHLYLTMAEQMGYGDFVQKCLEYIVPEVFTEVATRSTPPSFPENGNDYEIVRYALAQVLSGVNTNPELPERKKPEPTATPKPSGGNLLLNPGFEDGFAYWDEDWDCNEIETENVYSGSKAIRISEDGGRAQILDGFTEGVKLTLEFWGKVDAEGSMSAVGVDCLDGNGKKIPGGQFQVEVDSTEYQKYTVSLTTIPGTEKIQVWMWGCGGYMYCDDFVLYSEDGFTPPGGNLLFNPGFEDGFSGWNINFGKTSVDAKEYHSGTKAARVKMNPGAGYSLDYMRKKLANGVIPGAIFALPGGRGQIVSGVPENTSYKLSAWGKCETDDGLICIGVVCLDESGKALKDAFFEKEFGSTSFTQCSLEFTTVEGTRKLLVYFYNCSADGKCYVDDFSLTRN